MKLCACGCGQEIKIKKHHKYYGIPNYIKGHTKTNTNRKASLDNLFSRVVKRKV